MLSCSHHSEAEPWIPPSIEPEEVFWATGEIVNDRAGREYHLKAVMAETFPSKVMAFQKSKARFFLVPYANATTLRGDDRFSELETVEWDAFTRIAVGGIAMRPRQAIIAIRKDELADIVAFFASGKLRSSPLPAGRRAHDSLRRLLGLSEHSYAVSAAWIGVFLVPIP